MKILGHPLVFAASCLAFLWGLTALLVRRLAFWEFIIGTDGRASTSKLQFFAWTAVALFSYLAMWAARTNAPIPTTAIAPSQYADMPGAAALAPAPGSTTADGLPSNLLLAMGFSAGTLALAKGITVNQVNSGTIDKRHMTSPTWDLSSLFEDDLGYIDLGKLQLLAWTFVAIGLYLHQVVHAIYFNQINLYKSIPDIDSALMVLMGLGSGAYLAKKAVGPDSTPPAGASTVSPRVIGARVFAPAVGGGSRLEITGSSFGTQQGTSQVTINGRTLSQSIAAGEWSDTVIRVLLPIKLDGTVKWPGAGVTIQVSVLVAGVEGNRVEVSP